MAVTMIAHWFQFIDMLHASFSSAVYVLLKAHLIHHRTLGANVQNQPVPVLYKQKVFTIFIMTCGFIYFTSFILFYTEQMFLLFTVHFLCFLMWVCIF